WAGARYAADGRIWVLSNSGSDFVRLGLLDPADGRFEVVSAEPRWDITDYAVAPGGHFIAYAINEAGVSRLRVLEPGSGRVRTVEDLPDGVLHWSFGDVIQIAPWGEIGLSLSS